MAGKSRIFRLLLWKELLHTFRDKDVLIYTFIVPAIIYPLLLVIGIECFVILQEANTTGRSKYGVSGEAPTLAGKKKLATVLGYLAKNPKYERVDGNLSRSDLFAGRVSMLLDEVTSPDRPKSSMVIAQVPSAIFSQIAVNTLNDSFEADFTKSLNRAAAARGYNLADFKARPAAHKNVNRGKAEVFSMVLGFVFFSLFNVALGGAYPAIAATSEEFERNTIEPVLMLPVNRWFVIAAKLCGVTLIALIAGSLNLFSLLADSGLMVAGSAALKGNQAFDLSVKMQPQMIPVVVLLYIVIALVFSAILMMTAAFCRTVRSSQQWISLPLSILMLMLVLALVPTIELNNWTAAVPLLNYMLITRSLFNGEACGRELLIAFLELPILIAATTRITASLLYKK